MEGCKDNDEVRGSPYLEIDSIQLSKLYDDRIEFKLWSAQQHLNKLKEIEYLYGGIMGRYRIYAESELDCYFAQIIGARDSLLIFLNDTLMLGITDRRVDLCSVNTKLRERGIQYMIKELNKASSIKSWFWKLNEYRNKSVHRQMLKKRADAMILEGRSSSVRNYLLEPPDYKRPMHEEIVQYLETSIRNTRNLIDEIRKKLNQIDR
jgi:Cthe_2314-like HEPN